MINKYKLGIVIKNKKIINHRSFIKVFLNSILRNFGLQIAIKYDPKLNIIGSIKLVKCPVIFSFFPKEYNASYDYIIKERFLV